MKEHFRDLTVRDIYNFIGKHKTEILMFLLGLAIGMLVKV